MATPWTLPTDREPLEHDEQKDFIRWFRRTYPGVLIYAIPNGGKRSKGSAMKLKAEGVVAGIPDLSIPEWGPLWIEMKRQKSGSVSKVQKEIHQQLRDIGQTVLVCKGSVDAQEQVKAWLPENLPRYQVS
jgi:hypothetical protein